MLSYGRVPWVASEPLVHNNTADGGLCSLVETHIIIPIFELLIHVIQSLLLYIPEDILETLCLHIKKILQLGVSGIDILFSYPQFIEAIVFLGFPLYIFLTRLPNFFLSAPWFWIKYPREVVVARRLGCIFIQLFIVLNFDRLFRRLNDATKDNCCNFYVDYKPDLYIFGLYSIVLFML